jgi:aminoglycoside phosphotransferase (APT) family kinase protein
MTAISNERPTSGPDPEVDERDLPDRGRLEDWLRRHVDGFAGPARLSRFEGGQSNPTYRVDSSSGIYVLRSKPTGVLLPSAHAVDREFRVLSALKGAPFRSPTPMPTATTRR